MANSPQLDRCGVLFGFGWLVFLKKMFKNFRNICKEL